VLEAMAMGRPVITTDVPGCRETTKHNVTGFLVQPRRPADVAAAMRGLLSSPELRAQLGLAGHERAASLFSAPSVASATTALLRRSTDDARAVSHATATAS
jgi:hypothetical protein